MATSCRMHTLVAAMGVAAASWQPGSVAAASRQPGSVVTPGKLAGWSHSWVQPRLMRTRLPLCMAKGDGKQRRPKQAKLPPGPPPPPPPPPPPARNAGRVTSNSLVSVRKQITLVKAYRAFKERRSASAPQRTRFRKPVRTDANATAAGGAEHADADIDWQAPLLFIDGYNVINAWPRLKKRFSKGDLLGAREMLLADVADFGVGRYEIVCVFDAAGSADRIEGKDRLDEYAGGLVTVAYAHDSADAYIERETRRYVGEGRSVVAATDDNGIKLAAGLHGATTMGSGWLVRELKASRKNTAAVLDEFNKVQRKAAGRSTLADALDAATRDTWDRAISEGAERNAGVSRKQREALAAMEEARATGELEKGALADRRRTLAELRSRQRAPGAARRRAAKEAERAEASGKEEEG